MYFAEVPEHRPFIVGIRPRYRVGDSLRANCTSKHSKPAANLTWVVNDLPVRFIFHFLFQIDMCTSLHKKISKLNLGYISLYNFFANRSI